MIFSPNVERWRYDVAEQAQDIPVDTILALIAHESGGDDKRISKRSTRSKYTRLEMSCGLPQEMSAKAIGLMQITPILLRSYNQKHKTDISPCELYQNWPLQLKIGISFLKTCLLFAHNIDPSIHQWPKGPLKKEQTRIGVLAYARGIGAMKEKLDQLRSEGRTVSFDSLRARFPDFGSPEKPYIFAELISKSIPDISVDVAINTTEKKKPNLILPLIAFAAVMLWRKS